MIEILYGPIASGKSTYARNRVLWGQALVVSDDAIVMAVHGGEYRQYSRTLKPMYKGIGDEIIRMAVALNLNVVIDSTGMKRSTRDYYRLMAKRLDYATKLVVFRDGVFLGAEDGERRFKADPRGLPLEKWREVGEDHAKHHDPIENDEEYHLIEYVKWEDKA